MLRRAVVVGVVLVGALAGVVPAAADSWGSVTCEQNPTPDCLLGAGRIGPDAVGRIPRTGDPPQAHRDFGSSPGPGGAGGDTIVGGKSTVAQCAYLPSDYQPPAGATTAAVHAGTPGAGGAAVHLVAAVRGGGVRVDQGPPGPGPGAWYVWRCTTPGITDGLVHPPVFLSAPPAPGAPPVPSAAQLALAARNQLRLPTPGIAVSPAGEQLVGLPTWWWLSAGWTPIGATVSVPGVVVTAYAHPRSVTWSAGDGATVTCAGPGTPFSAGLDPAAGSPTCGHTYRVTSAGQPGQVFPVSATVAWTVTWAGAGQAGVFPDLTTHATVAVRVAQVQALNTG